MRQKIYDQVYLDWSKNKKLLSKANIINWISQNRNKLTRLVNLLKQVLQDGISFVLHNDKDGEKFNC